ncbi:PQQ-dependent sugar dehydrogenase [Tautonia rosea]|uniref:PQQ-dependent sugar dehydrogenase n=1 Tax=Tautonia rosea TaxID=2728037 RepID=UPI0014727F1E|nr:PQQ-dependent sugar dehydrogenase [Tautonia rosea]
MKPASRDRTFIKPQHIASGRRSVLVTLMAALAAAMPAGAEYDPLRFEKQVVAAGCEDPIQLEVLPGGDVLFIERAGRVRRASAGTGTVEDLATIPVALYGEVGLLGLARDPEFERTGGIFLFFCPKDAPETMRLSRFTLADAGLDLASEVPLLDYPIDSGGAVHMGGGLHMDGLGNLHIGTGDNCPPIPELPVDRRPGRENFDAMRTSANSFDLRGKVLRIHPEPDGTYTIPKGNLFDDPARGRPEIYAMGCRNPFRVTVDDRDGCVYWGDVGPNIQLDLGLGPNGYDEFNRAPQAGNFGWPMFVGPNEAYRDFDFATRTAGPPFDPARPVNDSPNNTGARELPPPRPAYLWYPSGPSNRFPSLGSGGRSAMAGPVYHADGFQNSPLRLPDELDGVLFIYEWTRNWIHIVRRDEAGELASVEPFLPAMAFRKPIDMEIGPDGTLYLLEYGDTWYGNTDAQVVRLVYRRGNRAPEARLAADPPAGKHPLLVRMNATGSSDRDPDDVLSFAWEVDGRPAPDRSGPLAEFTFDEPGSHRVAVVVTDRSGASSSAVSTVRVGNAPPSVTLVSPVHGSFFDPGETIRYEIRVTDSEDGSSDQGAIAPGRVLLNRAFLSRRADPGDDLASGSAAHPGLELMRKTTCFSCHTTRAASAGPPYREVGRKYAEDPEARERLASKIVSGGAGVWGDQPMPPHPQHDTGQTRLMVDWILSLAQDDTPAPVPGTRGFFRAEPTGSPAGPGPGVLTLTAEYTDDGAEGAPPLRAESSIVLHARRKPASSADRRQGVDLVDVFERQAGMVARFTPGDWIAFRDVNLADIDRVTWSVAAFDGEDGAFALRVGAPDGPELARVAVQGASDALGEIYREQTTPLTDPVGSHDLYVVALLAGAPSATTPEPIGKGLSLAWLEFRDAPEALTRKQAEREATTKIVLIPTKLDHPWATHMYSDVCRILAACLNQTPGVEAVVSPELDWPADGTILEDADAIVYYSRPSGDILLSPEHRHQAEALLNRGVGFSAIHWSTGAEQDVGPRFLDILGGWFNFDHSGLKVDTRPLRQVEPDHPVSLGWAPYDLHDEFYLNLKFSPDARPVLSVDVDGTAQTVAWVLERADGGRSFGTTLGHFHENFAIPQFRRMLVNGILWSAGVDVPQAGAPVDVDPALLELPPQVRPVIREWSYDDLRPLLDNAARPRSFARGEQLFRVASCVACHRIAGSGGVAGPDLTDVRQRLAAELDPGGALLRSIVEPSHSIVEAYRSQILALADGQVLSGLVVAEEEGTLQVVTDPSQADQPRLIPADQVEERSGSDVSLMPAGLLNTLDREEVLDLLAYVEAGGDSRYVQFSAPPRRSEPWADVSLPVKAGLRWWLDAGRINQGRSALGLEPLATGSPVAVWPDASGYGRHPRQRRIEAQPRFEDRGGRPAVRFDGNDDALVASMAGLTAREFTAVLVVQPDHNRGWPGLISGNAFDRNDYQSGFNIDLMPEPRDEFSTLMVEGPGFIGVRNLMTESLPFGRFVTISVTSRPGPDGVQLSIDGRPQGSIPRQEGILRLDELTVGARFWSNDPNLPPFARGFFAGAVAHVLFYDRVLDSSELTALQRDLSDPPRPGQ